MMLNAFPSAPGHLMVAPCRHADRLDDLKRASSCSSRGGRSALSDVMTPPGFNVGPNLRTVAGAGIADHLHLHVVPRWKGKINFMPGPRPRARDAAGTGRTRRCAPQIPANIVSAGG
ncbi:MAG: HIT domain-containing protein [Solirubrobacteraceae bacterium]